MSDALRVKLLRTGARLPVRATPAATGLDLHACLDAPIEIGPDVTLVPIGIAIEAPVGFDVQVRPRSGLSRQGVNVILGTIDADYRGEILVSMHTFGSKQTHTVSDGDRIAQLVVSRFELVEVEAVQELSESERGVGGHGSTGR
ncbi:MAG: dUTP diphosphatase [Dehalococcoidia bacterium]|nr:dUTP diphosphatase [Dehalococcoidia bacterium]